MLCSCLLFVLPKCKKHTLNFKVWCTVHSVISAVCLLLHPLIAICPLDNCLFFSKMSIVSCLRSLYVMQQLSLLIEFMQQPFFCFSLYPWKPWQPSKAPHFEWMLWFATDRHSVSVTELRCTWSDELLAAEIGVEISTIDCRMLQVRAPGMARGLCPQNGVCPPSPPWNKTGQESGGELCKIFEFWSFLQSKSVNNVSASGGLSQMPYEGFALECNGRLLSSSPWAI